MKVSRRGFLVTFGAISSLMVLQGCDSIIDSDPPEGKQIVGLWFANEHRGREKELSQIIAVEIRKDKDGYWLQRAHLAKGLLGSGWRRLDDSLHKLTYIESQKAFGVEMFGQFGYITKPVEDGKLSINGLIFHKPQTDQVIELVTEILNKGPKSLENRNN